MTQEEILAAQIAQQRQAYLESISPVSRIPDWQSKTPQEIADFSTGNHQTLRAMNAQELRNWLADNWIAWPNLQGGWSGPVVDLVAPLAASGDAESIALSRGIERLLAHLFSAGATQVDTHLDNHGPLLAGIVSSLSLPGDLTESLYSLGGGRRFPALNIEQATAMQTALKHALRVINATALFSERMQAGDDAAQVMATAWTDAEV